MRDYGNVHTSFWTSATIRSLSEDGRHLALYLLTSPHATISGVFRLPDGYLCEDLQWKASRVWRAFSELASKGYALRCRFTNWVWVCKHFEWNPLENPNQVKSAKKVALSIPDECSWKPLFMRACGESLGIKWEPLPNSSETLPEEFLNQEQKQEQEQKHLTTLSGKPDDSNLKAQAKEVLEFLNSRVNKSFRAIDTNLDMILARLRSGATVQDCKSIIAKKRRDWLSDPKMAEYLRPATLFNKTKFEQYLGELVEEAPR